MATSYRVGVIGTSWAAKSPLPTFQSYPGIEIAAICSGGWSGPGRPASALARRSPSTTIASWS